jgi:hypothetical protein
MDFPFEKTVVKMQLPDACANSMGTNRQIHFRLCRANNKKPTWSNTCKVINHVGLLFNRPPSELECHLFSHPTNCFITGKTFASTSKDTVGLQRRGDNGQNCVRQNAMPISLDFLTHPASRVFRDRLVFLASTLTIKGDVKDADVGSHQSN